MVALIRDFEDSVRELNHCWTRFIISGAGLPPSLPAIHHQRIRRVFQLNHPHAIRDYCKKWGKLGYRPDAIVLEDPLGGGHLGFKT